MKYINLIVILILIVLVIMNLLSFELIKTIKLKKSSKMKIDDFVICHSWASSVFLILMSMILLITLSVTNYLYSFDLSGNIIISIMIILSLFGSYASVRQRIVIQKDKISVYPLFGKVKLYTFILKKSKRKTEKSRSFIRTEGVITVGRARLIVWNTLD